MVKINSSENIPYQTGPESYNKKSGKKTLFFIGGLIALVVILSIFALLAIIRQSSVLIK